MGIFRKTLLSIAALCVSGLADASNRWSYVNVHHKKLSIRAIFSSETPESVYRLWENEIKSAIEFVEKKNAGEFTNSFDVLFDDRPYEHNGIATVLPRNFIWIYTVPPKENSSIGFSKNYILSTLIHEMGHMFYLQHKSGMFNLGSRVFGNLSSPLASYPRWIHEGWATWTEERYKESENLPYLNLLKRSYSENLKEPKPHILTTSHLEGDQRTFQRVHAGEIPYAFGYEVIDKFFKLTSPENFASSSSKSLGISFRKESKRYKTSFESLFAEVEKDWASTKTNSRSENSNESYRDLNLYGLSKTHLISNNENSFYIIKIDDHSRQPIKWVNWHWKPLMVISNQANKNLVYIAYIKPSHKLLQNTLVISLFKETSSEYSVPECDIYTSQEDSFYSFIETNGTYASFTSKRTATDLGPRTHSIKLPDSCSDVDSNITPNKEPILPSGLGSDLTTWAISKRSDQEYLTIQNIFEIKKLSPAICERVFSKPSKLCVVGIENNKNFRNPTILTFTNNDRGVEQKTISVPTGAQEIVANETDLYWIEKHWSFDSLNKMSLSNLASLPTQKGPSTEYKITKDNSYVSTNKSQINKYGYHKTLFPKYWMPKIFTSRNGFVVSGYSWFHDITKTYEGYTSLGYDSYSKRPNVSANLKKRLGQTNFLDSISIGGYYYRDKTRLFTLDMSTLYANLNKTAFASPSTFINFQFQPSYKFTSINNSNSKLLVPTLQLSVHHKNAPELTNSMSTNHSNHTAGLLLLTKLSKIKETEVYAGGSISHSWPMSWVVQLEYGKTSNKNLPFSYFEWGGYFPVHFYQTSFISRGFAPVSGLANQIGRIALIGGTSWAKNIGGLGWSRLEFEELTQDFILETVTYDSLFSSSPHKFSKSYFSTIGTELNLWTKALFYIKSRAFIGVYKGFGEGAETRFALGFSSYLDI